MGTTLTGTTPQDTYDSLIKVTDNGPLSGSLKTLTDGLGNDSALALSTGGASVTGTLAVSGNATFDTTTLVVDAANNRVGVGESTPTEGVLVVNNPNGSTNNGVTGNTIFVKAQTVNSNIVRFSGAIATDMTIGRFGATDNLSIGTTSGTTIASFLSSGNVGIGATPSAWASGYKVLQGSYITSYGYDQNVPANLIVSNAYNDGTWKYGINAPAAKLNVVGWTGVHTFEVAASGTAGAAITWLERARIDNDGLKFNGDTAAANALDDYEEGTWTATLTDGTVTKTATCSYTKIGRMVYLSGGVSNVEDPSSFTGQVYITGVPFVPAFSVSLYGINNYLDTASVFVPYLESNQQIRFYKVGAVNADYVQMQGSDLNFYSDIIFAGQFTV